MKQNHNPHHGRQGRPNQKNNQKRGGKPRHNNANRNQQPTSLTKQVDSRGPGGNQRGNAKQLYERYKILAMEKRPSDREESENLMQHADHYFRIYSEFAGIEAEKQVQRDHDQAKKAKKEQQDTHNGVTENGQKPTDDSKPASKPAPKPTEEEASEKNKAV